MEKKISFKLLDLKNFSIREALWVALLLHLIVLLLPQSVSPFLLFMNEPVALAEPIVLNVAPPELPDPALGPEEREAVTPEAPSETPESPDPTVRGNTNMRRLQQPRLRERPQGQRSPFASESGSRLAPRENETAQEAESESPSLEEMRRRFREALQEPLFDGDFFAVHDQDRPSSARPLEGLIELDTYAWDYMPYILRMKDKIFDYWAPKLDTLWIFQQSHPGLTVYSFEIRRDGSLVDVALLRPSGTQNYDRSAHYAIVSPYPGRQAAFPPLPPDFPNETLTVTFGFWVNMRPLDNR